MCQFWSNSVSIFVSQTTAIAEIQHDSETSRTMITVSVDDCKQHRYTVVLYSLRPYLFDHEELHEIMQTIEYYKFHTIHETKV